MENRHFISNDNAPPSQHPLGDSIGFNAALREMSSQRVLMEGSKGGRKGDDGGQMNGPDGGDSGRPTGAFRLYRVFLLLWASAVLSVLWFQTASPSLGGQIVSFVALICSALALSPAAQSIGRFRLTEFSMFTALAGTLCLWFSLSELYFFEVSYADAAIGFSAVTLVTAWLMRSDMALVMSCCAALTWVTLHQTTGLENLIPLSFLPLIIGVQLITASRHSSMIAITTACFAAYLWLYLMFMANTAQNHISPLHIAGLVTLIGGAHHRIGKTLDDASVGGAPLHAVLGWCVSIAGALALQDFWLSSGEEIWRDLSANPGGILAFRISAFLALAIAGLATLLRGGLSIFAMLGLLVIGLGVIAMSHEPDVFAKMFTQFTGLNSAPEIGFILAGFILSSALVMTSNGFRRGRLLMVLAGLAGLSAQGYILNQFGALSQMSWIILGASFVFSLCLSVLLSAPVLRSVLQRRVVSETVPTWTGPSGTAPSGAPIDGAYFSRASLT